MAFIGPSGIEDRQIMSIAPQLQSSHGHKGHHKVRKPPQPPPSAKIRLSDEQEAIRQKIIDGKRQRKEARIAAELEHENRIALAKIRESEQLKVDLKRADNAYFSYWNDVYEMPWFWEMHAEVEDEEEQEEEEEEEENECCICMDKEPDMTLQPCGHKCICVQCASNISNCPLCRAIIENVNPLNYE